MFNVGDLVNIFDKDYTFIKLFGYSKGGLYLVKSNDQEYV